MVGKRVKRIVVRKKQYDASEKIGVASSNCICKTQHPSQRSQQKQDIRMQNSISFRAVMDSVKISFLKHSF